MAQRQPARRKVQSAKTTVAIPDQLYFRIGDVARLCSLPAYVLRFWETEFSQLKPQKASSGQRLYRRRDVEIVLEIKRLLYDEGFTIAGARRSLAEQRQPTRQNRAETALAPKSANPPRATTAEGKGPEKTLHNSSRLHDLRNEMRELLTLLDPDKSGQSKEGNVSPSATMATKRTKDRRKTREDSDEPTLF